MENRKLEKLIREKLGGMEIAPSGAVQDVFARKIRLVKQRTLIRRLSIAAGILLFAVAGMYVIRIDKVEKVDLANEGTTIQDQSFDSAESSELAETDISSEEENALADGMDMPDSKTDAGTSDPSGTLSEGMVHNDPAADGYSEKDKALAVLDQSKTDETFQDESKSDDIVQNEKMTGNMVAVEGKTNDMVQDESKTDDIIHDEAPETMLSDQADQGVYVEYLIDGQEANEPLQEEQYEPVKITIEYIASGNNTSFGGAGKTQTEADRKKFYSKLDNIKSVDEVLGDIRTYKDRLFALDFKKEEKVKDEETLEK